MEAKCFQLLRTFVRVYIHYRVTVAFSVYLQAKNEEPNGMSVCLSATGILLYYDKLIIRFGTGKDDAV